MSAQSGGQAPQGPREKFLAGRVLDVEQIVLNAVNEIVLSHSRVAQTGDATQANMVYIGLVLNLDAFVRPLVRRYVQSKSTRMWYESKRTEIVKRWPIGGDNPNIADARALFDLTIDVLAQERSFKMRRWTFFGIGWNPGQRVDYDTMVAEDEREGPEELGSESGRVESRESD
jgi:hypothetical protein